MKEQDIHKLIEQQNPEAKQHIWKKVQQTLFVIEEQNGEAVECNNVETVHNKNKQPIK